MFSQLPIHRLLIKALSDVNFTHPTAVQAETIPLALDGCDIKVNAETGSGKTLAYLLPTLNRLLTTQRNSEGVRALVLLPTRELALQVFSQCEILIKHTNLTACLVSGGEDIEQQAALLLNDPNVVIATTGRLLEHMKMGTVDLSPLDILVLDEADRMLDMGFSDDVLAIAEACNNDRQTMLFSATLNSKWLPSIVKKVMNEPDELNITAERAAPSNIHEQVILSDDDKHKLKLVLWLLANEDYEKAILFTNSRDQADLLCSSLTSNNQRAAVLHGEIESLKRKRVMTLMREGHVKVLVATDVASRGLDISGVDLVINFDMPKRGDIYTHRIGRSGREEREGLAITLVGPMEWNLKASVERYLKRKFEPRTIAELKANYTGPKNLKASGQAVGKKKNKKTKDKTKKGLAKKKNTRNKR